jgi:hypothetical protein
MALFTIMKAENIVAIGLTIRCMVKEHYITQMVELLIKDNGKMIRFMEKEFYIMKILLLYLSLTIIDPLINVSKLNAGYITKEHLIKMTNKEKEYYC